MAKYASTETMWTCLACDIKCAVREMKVDTNAKQYFLCCPKCNNVMFHQDKGDVGWQGLPFVYGPVVR